MINPDEASALAQQAATLKGQGRIDEAVAAYRRSLQLAPQAITYNNLGNLHAEQGQRDEAIDCYRQAIALAPDYGLAHYNLGTALGEQGEFTASEACLRRAIAVKPDFALAHSSLANVLQQQGQLAEAAASYRRAIELRPDFAEAYYNLATAQHGQGQLAEAAINYQHALGIKPEFVEALVNLSQVVDEQGDQGQAQKLLEQAIELDPQRAATHANLADVLSRRGFPEQAFERCLEALRLGPELAIVHSNLGKLHGFAGRFDEAERCYTEALRLDPNYADARFNRSFVRLLQGNFDEGWPDYESRLKRKDAGSRKFTQPMWRGEPLAGKTILIHAEQGLGDTFQFVRYVSLVKERGGRVVFECPPALVKLLTGHPGIDQLVPRGQPLPKFDVYVPLMSLPGIVWIAGGRPSTRVPYLQADPQLVEKWRHELASYPGMKVGLVWQGNRKYPGDHARSIALKHFAPLAGIDGVHLFSLQKGYGSEQLAEWGPRWAIEDLGPRLDETTWPFGDTAAVLANLDLLITSDTATPHLAGALGVATWVALPWMPDWRWLLAREDSPWYPTMRLFRQPAADQWDAVFKRLARELRDLVALTECL